MTYLLVNLGSILIPLLFSFEKKLQFYKNWRFLFPAIFITGAFFLVWDYLFTEWGVWGFNEMHLLGIYLFGLPIEELMFFICIPYACVFGYEALNYFVKKDLLGKYSVRITIFLIAFLGFQAYLYRGFAYTFATTVLVVLFLILQLFVVKSKRLGRFYFAYLVLLIPFLVVNGILTGTGIEEEVVWYNNSENLSVRILTIPVEDLFYGMLLILMNLSIYEYLKQRATRGNGGEFKAN
ncbi:MAG: hypothetical protein COB85_00810 [Bacteroidetes bacterium]|nr:MAG: hypothetical protein COB85_00810 [Bacteroidota bacterium]